MDISVRIFLDADEFVRFLEYASSSGGSVLYEPELRAPFKRVEPGAPLPDELTAMLRAPLIRGSNHLLYVGVGDPAHDPKATDPRKTICAYFGGFDRALYLSPISARSNDPATLSLMRRLKRWLLKISKTGVAVIGSPGEVRHAVPAIHYTEGAARAARAGFELRQRGVANVRYEIDEAP